MPSFDDVVYAGPPTSYRFFNTSNIPDGLVESTSDGGNISFEGRFGTLFEADGEGAEAELEERFNNGRDCSIHIFEVNRLSGNRTGDIARLGSRNFGLDLLNEEFYVAWRDDEEPPNHTATVDMGVDLSIRQLLLWVKYDRLNGEVTFTLYQNGQSETKKIGETGQDVSAQILYLEDTEVEPYIAQYTRIPLLPEDRREDL